MGVGSADFSNMKVLVCSFALPFPFSLPSFYLFFCFLLFNFFYLFKLILKKDGDDAVLRSQGRPAERDIVQVCKLKKETKRRKQTRY